MKLFYSPNSPYARKCRVVAIEKGLLDTINFVKVDPWENSAELLEANPLGMVPTLLFDNKTALCESPVICEYLDALAPAPQLFPALNSRDRYEALSLAALADGIMDAAVSCVIENMRRPEDKRWPEWVKRKEDAINRVIAHIAKQEIASTTLHIGVVNTAVALGYINFRMPQINWQQDHPKLAEWYKEFLQRTSMQATLPVA